ncbi:MAG: LexA family transcriptional regulator [Nitrospiraceae bacterium]|nr:LexA family transcriptional regulator [Nitrospiraceae bacterium]
MLAKRKELGMSLREAASLAGMSHVHIKDIEDDKIKPSFEKIINLLKAYHADIQEFLDQMGYLPQNIEPAPMGKLDQIPVISWVAAGRWQAVCDEFQPGDADDWVSSDVKGQNIFAVRVKGDSMEPEFVEGDIIIVDPHVMPNPGDYVIVRNDEGEATLKQLKQYGKIQVLHPLNSKYQDIELLKDHEYVMVGKVVEKKKRY